MTTAEGFQPATGQWDVFALAAAASLGPFTHAHLAPKFPPVSLNSALATYLHIRDDELLLVLIDSGGSKPMGWLRIDNAPGVLDRDHRRPRAVAPASDHSIHQIAHASTESEGC